MLTIAELENVSSLAAADSQTVDNLVWKNALVSLAAAANHVKLLIANQAEAKQKPRSEGTSS
jgi:hypothetical protein